jgi:hypothetical protein
MATIPEQSSGALGLNSNIDKKTNPYIPGSDLYKMDGWYLSESFSITKRRGFQKLNTIMLSEGGVPATFTGIFEYIPSVGSLVKMATTTLGLYAYGTPIADTWNAIGLTGVGGARTGVSTNLYDSAILLDQMYIGGGSTADKNIRFTGTVAYQMGINGPATHTATTAVGGTGLSPVTGYMYNYTYYNSALGQESNPATADSTLIKPVNQTVTVTVTRTADTQVDKINIYRTTDGGALPLLVGTIANITGTGTTTFADNYSDATLTVAIERYANGVPAHFSAIDVFQGVAFMAGDSAHLSRVWFSGNGKPACVNSNDYRDLDPNDGDIVTGLKRFQTTIVAFKGNSIWNAAGTDRDTFVFERRATTVGSVNNACIVEVPMKNSLVFISPDAKFYSYDGTDATPQATNIDPIMSGLNIGRLSQAVGTLVPSLNQARWIVPNDGSTYCDLIIWYDYILDKWGTADVSNLQANCCATLHDASSKLQFFTGGVSNGYVQQGDSSGTDGGLNITCDVVDRGHPLQDATPENQKVFSHIFVWFKPNAYATLSVYGYIDDPDGTPILLGTIPMTNPSGQGHIHMNKVARRLYVRLVETSNIQGLVIRGWKVYYKNVGRHNAA